MVIKSFKFYCTSTLSLIALEQIYGLSTEFSLKQDSWIEFYARLAENYKSVASAKVF